MEILQRNVVKVIKNNSQNGMLGNIPGQFVQCETERLTYSNFALPRMEIINTKNIPSSFHQKSSLQMEHCQPY